MEICTLEFVKVAGQNKESVVLYFKDRQAAEKYKEEYLDGQPDVIIEDDAIGFQYYNDGEFWSEINDILVDHAWRRLAPQPPSSEVRVETRVETREVFVEPDLYRVKYNLNHNNMSVCKMLRSEDEMKDYMVKAIGVAVGPIEVLRMSLDQLFEEYENA